MALDLAHKRPWLLFSLFFGLTYPFVADIGWGGIWITLWKMAGAALLVPYALRRHHHGDFALLAAILGLYAIGDGLVIDNLQLGAVAFACAHIIAIWLFYKHRRKLLAPSQKGLAVTVLLITPFLSFLLPADRDMARQFAAYGLLLGIMAAMAWSSNFPRYRVGMGAMLFVLSDLFIFAGLGPLENWALNRWVVWYSYYAAILLITIGVVQTLIKRGHFKDSEGF
jgi:hypothetical protein